MSQALPQTSLTPTSSVEKRSLGILMRSTASTRSSDSR